MANDDFLRRTVILKTRDQIDLATSSVFMVACFIIGVLALFNVIPLPKSLNETLQPVAHFAWATMLVLGSTFSFIGRLRNNLEIEAAGSLALALSFATYVVSITSVNLPSGVAVAAVFAALVVKYGYRGWVLNKVAREMRDTNGI